MSVNPYKPLQIYAGEVLRAYQHNKLSDLPPHVFALADEALFSLLRRHPRQCILIRCGADRDGQHPFLTIADLGPRRRNVPPCCIVRHRATSYDIVLQRRERGGQDGDDQAYPPGADGDEPVAPVGRGADH